MKKGGVTGSESPSKRSRTGSSPESQKKSPFGVNREEPRLPVLEGMRGAGFGGGRDSGLGFTRPSSKGGPGGGPGGPPPRTRKSGGSTGFGSGLGSASQDWDLPDVEADVTANFLPSWEDASAAQDKKQQQQKPKKASATSPQNSYLSHSSSLSSVPNQQFPFQPPQQQTQRPPPAPTPLYHQDNISVITGGSHPGTGIFSGAATIVSNSTSSSSNTGLSSGIFSSASSGTGMFSNASSGTGMFSSASRGTGMFSNASSGTPRSSGGPPFGQPPQPPQPQPQPQPPPLPPANPANATGSTTTVPKAELYSFFGKKPRRKQLGNEDYMHWNNGAKPHELKFTAIFQDPLTGECFPSGRYGNPQFFEVIKTTNTEGREMDVVWYTKKTYAEHGAAARCFDCLRYRDALQTGGHSAVHALQWVGIDPPYTREQAPGIPQVPPDIGDRIDANKKRIQDFLAGFQS